jgi:tetratricopeptide (TPR) repeat protein
LCLQGNFDAAVDQSSRTLRVANEAGDSHVVGWALHCLGEARMQLGLLEEAELQLSEARERLMHVQDFLGVAHTLGLLGHCYRRMGDYERAHAALASGEALVERFDLRGGNVTALRLARAEVALDELAHAPPTDRHRLQLAARHACDSALRHAEVYRMGAPAAYRWQGTYAWLTNRPAVARSTWLKSEQLATDVGARLELGMTLLESGRWQNDALELKRALEIFAAARADYHQVLARAALSRAT